MARNVLMGEVVWRACRLLLTLYVVVFIIVIPDGGMVRCPLEGNLISIGPGMYPSNRTLDGGGRSILVLGSCEFMHNGTLTGLNYYVASSDWMILQIWRPVSLDAVSMMLVYERLIEPNSTDSITQIRFEESDLHVLEGDRIGFTKLNHTFPIPYVFNPQMSADLWYNRVPVGDSLPNRGEVITFEEMGFPYHFSITVTFRAQVNAGVATVLKPIWKHGDKDPDAIKGKTSKGSDLSRANNALHKETKVGAEHAGKEAFVDEDDDMELEDTVGINLPLRTPYPVTGKLEDGTLDTAEVTSLKGFSYSHEPGSVPPEVVTDAAGYTMEDEELTTSGPKFIFQTIMQTFSNLLPTSESDVDDEEEDETDVTSSATDTTEESDDVTDNSNTDTVEVTSIYTDVEMTSSTSSHVVNHKDENKGFAEKPNDTTN